MWILSNEYVKFKLGMVVVSVFLQVRVEAGDREFKGRLGHTIMKPCFKNTENKQERCKRKSMFRKGIPGYLGGTVRTWHCKRKQPRGSEDLGAVEF